MSDRPKTLVIPGHGLLFEGQPFDEHGKMIDWRKRVGRAKCRCGALSEELPNTSQRKKWHREVHKPLVAGMQTGTQPVDLDGGPAHE